MYTTSDENKPPRASGLNYREKLKSRKQVDSPPPSAVSPPVATPPPVQQSTPVATDDYENDSRGKMRLLQGLLLKHKGGTYHHILASFSNYITLHRSWFWCWASQST